MERVVEQGCFFLVCDSDHFALVGVNIYIYMNNSSYSIWMLHLIIL